MVSVSWCRCGVIVEGSRCRIYPIMFPMALRKTQSRMQGESTSQTQRFGFIKVVRVTRHSKAVFRLCCNAAFESCVYTALQGCILKAVFTLFSNAALQHSVSTAFKCRVTQTISVTKTLCFGCSFPLHSTHPLCIERQLLLSV